MIKLINKLFDPFRNVNSELILKKDGHSYIRMTTPFESTLRPMVVVPFFEEEQTIILRKLTGTQRRACGDFSLIQTVSDTITNKNKNISFKDQCSYARLQHEILKRSLVSPTYDEIMELNEFDVLRKEAEKQIEELEPIINSLPNGVKKEELKKEYYIAVSNAKYWLPIDFISHVISYALDIDGSDLRDITDEMLFEAAILAKKSKGRPSDYMPGNFKDHHLIDIDKRSWSEYYKREEKKKGNK